MALRRRVNFERATILVEAVAVLLLLTLLSAQHFKLVLQIRSRLTALQTLRAEWE